MSSSILVMICSTSASTTSYWSSPPNTTRSSLTNPIFRYWPGMCTNMTGSESRRCVILPTCLTATPT